MGNKLGLWACAGYPFGARIEGAGTSRRRLYSAGDDRSRCGRLNAGAGSKTPADCVAFPCVIYLTDDKAATLHNVRINLFESAAVTR